MEKQDTSELSGGVEVSPIDDGSRVMGIGDEGFERRVERG